MPAPDVTWKLEADFDFDDTYEEDLTPRVLPSSRLAIERGVNGDGEYRVSTLAVSLSNKDGRFTPGNTGSSLANRARLDVPIRFVATFNSTDYQMWTGYIRDWQYEWSAENGPTSVHNAVQIRCLDIAYYLQNSEPVNVTYSESRDTDAALVAITDAAGLGAADRDFDDGLQDLLAHYVSGQPALQAMMEVVISELGGFLWVKANGALRFENRQARLGSTPDHTWGDGTNVKGRHASGQTDRSLVITGARVRGIVFRKGQADVVMFRFSRGSGNEPADSLQIGAGETWGPYEFHTQAAYVSLTSPVAGSDYRANSAQDGTGSDRTSDLAVTLTDLGGGRFRLRLRETGGSAALYVTTFEVRGQPANFFADRPEASVTKSVAGVPANTNVNVDVPFASENGQQLLSLAWQICRTYRWAMPPLPLEFTWSHDDIATAMLTADIGELVRYTDTAVGDASGYHDDLYRIEAIRHLPQPGRLTRSVVLLSPAYEYRNLDAIAYDDFGRSNASGDLGTALSGAAWADDSGFDIASETARANTDTLSMANVDLIGLDYTDFYDESTHEADWVEGDSTGDGSVSKEADHLLAIAGPTSAGSQRAWVLDSAVDLTNIHTIRVDWANVGDASAESYLVASTWKDESITVFDARTSVSGPFSRTTTTLDVSGLRGEHYIRVHARNGNSGDTSELQSYVVEAVASDQVVEVALGSIGSGDEVGVVFRYVDANNHCRAYLDKGSNEVILERVVSGTVTELASPAFTVGTTHEMRVIVQADRIRVWVDFEPYIDDETGSLPSGTRVGLFARNANGTTTFDDFYGQGL